VLDPFHLTRRGPGKLTGIDALRNVVMVSLKMRKEDVKFLCESDIYKGVASKIMRDFNKKFQHN